MQNGKFVNDQYPYNEIDDITYEEGEIIINKLTCGDANTNDKLKYIKYYFNHEIIQNYHKIDIIIRMNMFEKYIQNKDKILNRFLK